MRSTRILDLCAGSGVVGLEFFLKHHALKKNDLIDYHYSFCEYQGEFISHLAENIKAANLVAGIYHCSFSELAQSITPDQKYNLILSNPPYFNLSKNRAPKNLQKEKCRFFVEESFLDFLNALSSLLAPQGRAYFLYIEGEFNGGELIQKTFGYFDIVAKFKDVLLVQVTLL